MVSRHDLIMVRTLPIKLLTRLLSAALVVAVVVYADQVAMGVEGESENYRVLNETAYTVANFSTKLPAFPEPSTPNTDLRNRRPGFTWTKVPDATQYRFQVKGGLFNVYTKTVDAGACGDTTCSNTPTDVLGYRDYQWRVQAKVGDTWRSWSAYKDFAVLKPDLLAPGGSIPDTTPTYRWTKEVGATEYHTALCLLLELDQSFTPYYWTNIADPELPFVGVLESTADKAG